MAETQFVTPPELAVGLPLSLLAGLLLGALGTFKHQFGISAASGGGLPIGLVAALALVAVFLIALRTLLGTRLYATAAGVGVIVAVTVLTQVGPGGSQLVVGNWVGVVWEVGPAICTAGVLLLPSPRPRAQSSTPAA